MGMLHDKLEHIFQNTDQDEHPALLAMLADFMVMLAHPRGWDELTLSWELQRAYGVTQSNRLVDRLLARVERETKGEPPDGPAFSDRACELVYDTGGHAGPFKDAETAAECARWLLVGSPTMSTIYVVPRDARTLDRANAIRVVRKAGDGKVTINLT